MEQERSNRARVVALQLNAQSVRRHEVGDFSQLSPEAKAKFWHETGIQIRALVGTLSARIPAADCSTVLDFIEHNEFGLALEHLADAVYEERSKLSHHELANLAELFARIELDPGSRLVALRGLAAP